MGYLDNPYSSPEKYDLEIVGEIDWEEESYQFDISVVWKEGRGKYYLGDDSGCSCPAPFEDYTKKEQLDGPMNKRSLEAALRYRIKEKASEDKYYGRPRAELEKDVRELLAKLK